MQRFNFIRVSAATVLALGALGAPAMAADPALIPMAAPMVEKAATALTEFTSGWYLRGDVGYRFNDMRSSQSAALPAIAASQVGDAFSVGGGIGYSRDWFRADVTLDWGSPGNYSGDAAGSPGFYTGKIDAVTAMANVYVDLGTWMGLTPYLGAGAGGTSLRMRDFRSPIAPVIAASRDDSRWRFAWAYMAGIAYRVSNNLLLDVGYRHLDFGSGETWLSDGNQLVVNGFKSDEVRVGVRYQID